MQVNYFSTINGIRIMKKSQSGFTLIELVVVIVLLGILGVTALGKFQDLSSNAEDAAVDGVASELSGSAAVNYANSLLGNTGSTAIDNTSANTTALACGNALLQNLFASGSTPGDYKFVFGAGVAPNVNAACDSSGDSYTCTVYNDQDNDNTVDAGEPQATASLICTGA